MPSKPESAERRIEDTLDALRRALTRASVPWMVIGGIAVIARGVRRVTTDIDVAVRGDSITIEQLAERLAAEDIRPRIADAIAFARESLVLLMRHTRTGVDLDISLAWSDFEIDALRTAEQIAFGRARVPMSSVASLVVFKAIAARPRDLEDIEALLVLHPEVDLSGVRARLTELAALAEAPEVIAAFEHVVGRVFPVTKADRAVPPREKRPTKKSEPTARKRRRAPSDRRKR